MSINLPMTVNGERYREEPFFRFSVKCDRETAKKIDAAAAKAGLSAAAFVQRHFEAILGSPAKPAEPSHVALAARLVAPQAVETFAARHDLGVATARVFLTMRKYADEEMLVRRSTTEIGNETGLLAQTAHHHMRRLEANGFLERIAVGQGKTSIYRILPTRGA